MECAECDCGRLLDEAEKAMWLSGFESLVRGSSIVGLVCHENGSPYMMVAGAADDQQP
jgi:hypothetical protein